jgi:superoxide dismutase, Fe-Mn family
MKPYEAKTFALPVLEGISAKSVEEHVALYQGYVKNFNVITATIAELLKDSEKNAHALSELVRRRSFEFDGMRLHELYFSQFEDGVTPMASGSPLSLALDAQYGGPNKAIEQIKAVAMMRGPGWSILYFDPQNRQFQIGFAGEQHQGHFVTLPIILALDVWEHAYLLDYGALGKGKYVEAFFANLNWSVIEIRFAGTQRG